MNTKTIIILLCLTTITEIYCKPQTNAGKPKPGSLILKLNNTTKKPRDGLANGYQDAVRVKRETTSDVVSDKEEIFNEIFSVIKKIQSINDSKLNETKNIDDIGSTVIIGSKPKLNETKNVARANIDDIADVTGSTSKLNDTVVARKNIDAISVKDSTDEVDIFDTFLGVFGSLLDIFRSTSFRTDDDHNEKITGTEDSGSDHVEDDAGEDFVARFLTINDTNTSNVTGGAETESKTTVGIKVIII